MLGRPQNRVRRRSTDHTDVARRDVSRFLIGGADGIVVHRSSGRSSGSWSICEVACNVPWLGAARRNRQISIALYDQPHEKRRRPV
jgi:hypothetical protein